MKKRAWGWVVSLSLALAFAGEALAQVTFSAATNFSAGAQPVSVVARDLNGDGKVDLAASTGFITPGTVAILQGTGTGSFGAATTLTMPGTSAFAVAVGDFNRDGIPDLAVALAGTTSNKVAILLGTGGGAFGAATTYPVGTEPVSIALADFNRDGKTDIVVANQLSNTVSVLLGNGNGTFAAAASHAVNTAPAAVTVADFNRDGNADIATADALQAGVSILLGDGTGGFAPASYVFVGTGPVSLVAADLDKDGKADLVVAHGGVIVSTGSVSVLLGNGDGSFGFAASTVVSSSGLRDVAVADFDGDGNADVAVTGQANKVWVLPGNGSGGLGTPASFAVGSDPRSIAIADLNGDAKADVVTANRGSGNVSILLNTSTFVVTALAWGSNDYGELGIGTMTPMAGSPTPVAVKNMDSIAGVAAGHAHTLAVRADGTAWAWGANFNGALGDGTTDHRSLPVQVYDNTGVSNPLTKVVALAGGGSQTSYALTADGVVWGWGNNLVGQTGTGDTHVTHWAWPVLGVSNAVAIAGGLAHGLALKADGTVWAWGWNVHGQIGDGTQIDRLTAVQMSGLSNVIAVSAGGWHSLALKADGTVWAWGWNDRGEIGDGTNLDRLTPVQVSGLTGVRFIHSSYSHSLAIKADGTVWSWGDNLHGQLGDGTTTHRNAPVQVTGLSGAVASAAAAMSMSVALKADGTVWTWGGNNWEGQLGDGLTTNYDRTTPAKVSGISGATALAASGQHSIVILKGMTIAAMITIVQSMNLAPGTMNGLTSTLSSAQRSLDAQNLNAACSQMRAFGNQVRAFTGRQLTPPQADRLLGAGQRVQSTMGCGA